MVQDTPSRKLDQYIVRFPDGMREHLKAEAKSNGRSLNAEIIKRLQDSFDRDAADAAYFASYQPPSQEDLDAQAESFDEWKELGDNQERNEGPVDGIYDGKAYGLPTDHANARLEAAVARAVDQSMSKWVTEEWLRGAVESLNKSMADPDYRKRVDELLRKHAEQDAEEAEKAKKP